MFSNRLSLSSIILKGSLWNVGHRKWSKGLGFENFDGILSPLDFEFVARVHLRLQSSFPSQLILLMVVRGKEYMKLDVGKMVDHNTRGSCIPIDSVKSGDDYSSLVHSIGTEAHIESDNRNSVYKVGSCCT